MSISDLCWADLLSNRYRAEDVLATREVNVRFLWFYSDPYKVQHNLSAAGNLEQNRQTVSAGHRVVVAERNSR